MICVCSFLAGHFGDVWRAVRLNLTSDDPPLTKPCGASSDCPTAPRATTTSTDDSEVLDRDGQRSQDPEPPPSAPSFVLKRIKAGKDGKAKLSALREAYFGRKITQLRSAAKQPDTIASAAEHAAGLEHIAGFEEMLHVDATGDLWLVFQDAGTSFHDLLYAPISQSASGTSNSNAVQLVPWNAASKPGTCHPGAMSLETTAVTAEYGHSKDIHAPFSRHVSAPPQSLFQDSCPPLTDAARAALPSANSQWGTSNSDHDDPQATKGQDRILDDGTANSGGGGGGFIVLGTSEAWLDLRRSSLRHAYVKVLLRQVLQAAAALHAANITHRDIKPENILVMDSKAHESPPSAVGHETADDYNIGGKASGESTDDPPPPPLLFSLTVHARLIDFGSAVDRYSMQRLFGTSAGDLSLQDLTLDYAPPEVLFAR